MKYLKCSKCGEWLTEDELGSKKVCMESLYGVLGDFPDRHYQTVSVCPYCGESSFDEEYYDEDEIPDLLNQIDDLKEQVKELKKEINKLKGID